MLVCALSTEEADPPPNSGLFQDKGPKQIGSFLEVQPAEGSLWTAPLQHSVQLMGAHVEVVLRLAPFHPEGGTAVCGILNESPLYGKTWPNLS
jgi:hypothetical protein